jgi:hypothetical protein
MQMSRSRGLRTARNSLSKKLGRHLHTSMEVARNDVLPAFRALFTGDEEFRVQTTALLGFDEKEVAYLLDEGEDSHAVKHLLERAGQVEGVRTSSEAPAAGLASFDEEGGDEG